MPSDRPETPYNGATAGSAREVVIWSEVDERDNMAKKKGKRRDASAPKPKALRKQLRKAEAELDKAVAKRDQAQARVEALSIIADEIRAQLADIDKAEAKAAAAAADAPAADAAVATRRRSPRRRPPRRRRARQRRRSPLRRAAGSATASPGKAADGKQPFGRCRQNKHRRRGHEGRRERAERRPKAPPKSQGSDYSIWVMATPSALRNVAPGEAPPHRAEAATQLLDVRLAGVEVEAHRLT